MSEKKLRSPVIISGQAANWRLVVLADKSLELQVWEDGAWVAKDSWS